ncbi:MAG: ATP-dependent helicase C-terminal domain-containing protein, partial [Pseudomonadota bacterium]
SITLPSGRSAPLDWLDEKAPLATARVQEVYGTTDHPGIGRSRTPVTLSLTSPAGRPVAITQDLSGFWSGGYRDMAKDMRARYPKHDWPDTPATAKPHEGRTKARLGR